MNEEVAFGPWSLVRPINKWNEYKVGKLEQWYNMSAQSIQICNSDVCSSQKSSTLSVGSRSSDKLIIESEKDSHDSTLKSVKKQLNQERIGVREYWEDPHSFDIFITSNQYELNGWPTKTIGIENTIGLIADFFAPKQPSGKPTKASRRSSKVYIRR